VEIAFSNLPQKIAMAHYARAKAYKINELVHTMHGDSFEWYGYTLSKSHTPELIEDIGLPKNDQNLQDYTTIGPSRIAEFQELLPKETIINGWIHSHGALNYRHFSKTDEENHLTVLNFVAARLRKPVAKRKIAIQDFVMLVNGQYEKKDLEKGSVCFITDVPVTEATIMETIYGTFCYGIVIGDQGWHDQVIYYQERGILSGHTSVRSKHSDITLVDTGRSLTESEIRSLSDEVEVKIQPNTDPPPEMIERM
jgi:hypothetical protein